MIKIGIVGAGIIGKEHANAIMNNPDCRLVAVCDTKEERAAEIAEKYNATSFFSYKEMCEKIEMDAVILNLPHFLHCEVTKYFLDNKINVLIEKPMAMTSEECNSMIESAQKNGVKLAVGHVQRYFSVYDDVKGIIESKKYGNLCMITEVRTIDYLKDRPKWFLDKKLSGGGIVMNYGAHTLDKIMYVTGERVIEAKSLLANPLSDDNIEVNAQILLKLTNGISAAITYCGCPGVNAYETAFYFEKGVVKTDGFNLYLSENGEFVHKTGTGGILSKQLCEFVKFLNDEPHKIVMPEYGCEIVGVLEKILTE